MIFIIITNKKTNTKFVGQFDNENDCQFWIKNHALKGKDRVIIKSDKIIQGYDVLLEEVDIDGKKQYLLEGSKEYEIERFSYNPFEVVDHWKNFDKARMEALVTTDWSQLPDVKLDSTERYIYREYREYIRNSKLTYKKENIHEWRILSFKEYKNMKYPK